MSFPGYAHAKFGDASTMLELAEIDGDKTGYMHVTDTQILKAAVKTGIISSFTTNINIEVGPTATLHVPQTLIIAGTTVNLEGTATFNKLIVEENGVLQTHSTSFTSNYVNGVFQAISEPGAFLLSSIQLKAGSDFQPAGPLILQVQLFEMKRYVTLEADYVDILAGTLMLEREAQLNVLGRASIDDPAVPAEAHGDALNATAKNGGGHAAQGGVGPYYTVDDAPKAYGTLYRKEDMADTVMRPGASGGNGGKGGGYIKIETDDFILDGILRASGEDSEEGGGGSGGSIYVETKELKGLGLMESRGGSVTCDDCGAGSGGYIGVDMTTDSYEGTYSAAGGTSSAPNGNGGPGSIYTVSDTNGEKLVVDNENGQKDYYMTLEEKVTNIEFSVVDLYNYAKLQLKKDGEERNLKINKVNGDGTGLLRIQSNQTGTLERVVSTSGSKMNSKLRINLELHKGGEFFLSETTLVLGLADTALDLDGTVRGVSNLYLGTGRHMRVGENARILADEDADADTVFPKVSFGVFQLEPNSICEYDPDIGSEMAASSINLKFAAKIYADYFELNASNIHLELESEMSCSSANRPDSEAIDVTDGSGIVNDDGTEVGGAAHGGVGGGSSSNAGVAYDSLYYPKQAGSRGTYDSDTDTKTGGKGGGRMHIRVGSAFINDGTMSANGDTADSEGAGGSGGSILVETYDVEGYGKFISQGGDGSGVRGAGSGGLVAILCSTQILFEGDYVVYGGSGATDTHSAGGGIVYLKDTRLGSDYKRLLLDNNGLPHDKYATIKEADMTEHYFDEVHMVNNAALHMDDDDRAVTLEIDQHYGDDTGLLHLHNNQKLRDEYHISYRHAFTTGVNFIVDAGAEILFPSILYTYGDGVFLSGQTESRSVAIFGTLTGVSDLILGFETLVYFGPESNTAFKSSDGSYLYQTDTKVEKFGTIDLRSLSQIKFAPDISVELTSAKIDSRYKSVISAETIFIKAGIYHIEAGASLTGSALERPEDTLDEELGQGQDAAGNVTIGTGGGYATKGGGEHSFEILSLFTETFESI